MKKNIDYYPHKSEAHRHPKFRMLRSLYDSIEAGWAAEGRFWALNNLIAQAEDCQLNLNKKRNLGVYADELGMSIEEFSGFISVLSGEDVELLTEISPNIYTTETVLETYESVASERERAKEKYEKSKKSVKNTTSTEKQDFSTEKKETSTENLYKVNKSEVKGIELNKKEVNGSGEDETLPLETSFSQIPFEELSTSTFNFVKNLFSKNTRIRDPNQEKHINPVLDFFTKIPEKLTEDDVKTCIEAAFSKLSPEKGVMMEYLTNNIQQKITARHEEILDDDKKKLLKQANIDRNEEKKKLAEDNERYLKEKLKEYKAFLDKNLNMFNALEKEELLRLFRENKVLQAGSIIEPKMESAELV